MKIYFLSSLPCALYIDDAFLGVVDGFERWTDISLSNNAFVRFCPQNACPIGFFLNENIRFSPPNGVDVYLLPDAVALYAREFPPSNFQLRLIEQKREKGFLATLFVQGDVQLCLQDASECFVASLPPAFVNASLHFYAGLCFVCTQTEIAVYTKKARLLLKKRVLSWRVEGNMLFVSLPLAGAKAECVFQLSDSDCKQSEISLAGDLPCNAYTFFESVLNGVNYREMLSDELAQRAEQIPAFLGDFQSVTPTDDPFCCALVYPKTKGVFDVRRLRVKMENEKICDISE